MSRSPRHPSGPSVVLPPTPTSIPTPSLTCLSDPISLGRIQVLFLPVGNVSPLIWNKWTTLIRKFAEIKLADVPGTSGGDKSKSGKTRFLPPSIPTPRTHLHLGFSEEPPSTNVLPLSLLQVSSLPLAVIGITDLSSDDAQTPAFEPSSTLRPPNGKGTTSASASSYESSRGAGMTRTSSHFGGPGESDWTHVERVGEFRRVLSELGLDGANGVVFPLTRRLFGVEEPEPEGYHLQRHDELTPNPEHFGPQSVQTLPPHPVYDEEDDLLTPTPGTASTFRRQQGDHPIRSKTMPAELSTQQRVKESGLLSGMVEIDASDSRPAISSSASFGQSDGNFGNRSTGNERNNESSGSGISNPTTGGTRFDKKGHEDKLVVVPKDGNVELVMGMLVADICASVLTEFGEIAAALETTTGIQTLNASSLPTLTQRSVPRPQSSDVHLPLRGGSPFPRSRSANSLHQQSHMSVTTNAIPARSASPITQRNPYSLSQSSLPLSSVDELALAHDLPSRPSSSMSMTSGHDVRPQNRPRPSSVMVSSDGKALTNTPPPAPGSKVEHRASTGLGMKRSSTGFSFGRVLSGKSSPADLNGDSSLDDASSVLASKPSSSAATTTSISSTSSATGRLKKVQADLWLLSGRLKEAIATYNESITSLRNTADNLWLASALEGLATAMLLEAWEERDGTDYTVPFLSSPTLSDIHDLLSNATARYAQTARPPDSLFPHGTESSESALAKLYTTCALRHARIILYTWASGGWGNNTLVALINGRPPRLYPPMNYQFRRRVFLKLSTMSKITRAFVGQIAMRAHGPWVQQLPPSNRIEVLLHLLAIVRFLGQERREALLTREIVGLVLESSMETSCRPKLDRRDSISTTSSITSVINGGPAIDTPHPVLLTFIRHLSNMNMESNLSTKVPVEQIILNLMNRVIDIAGFDINGVAPPDTNLHDIDRLTRYGWLEMQVDLLKHLVSIAEHFRLYQIMSVLACSALRLLHLYMTSAGHISFHQAYLRSLHSARRAGIDLGDDRWWLPDGLLLRAGLLPLPSNKIPHPVSGANVAEIPIGPFLYNPRDYKVQKAKILAIENEQLEFPFTILNPFGFDLNIQGISLVASGVTLDETPRRALLPAYGTETIILTAVPTQTGELAIEGCQISLPDGSRRRIPLPQANKGELRRRSKAAKDIRKPLGLNARPAVWRRAEDQDTEPQLEPLRMTVIQEQPLLWIKDAQFATTPLKLFEGEETVLTFSLHNISRVSVDSLELSFEEHPALSNGDAQSSENDTLPVFTWSKEYSPLQPGEKQSISVRCRGKLGCDSGVIRISYGQKSSEYARQVHLPITLAVYPTLICQSIHVLEQPNETQLQDLQKRLTEDIGYSIGPEESEATVSALLPGPGPACLVQLAFSNVTQYDLVLSVKFDAAENRPGQLSRTISASSTETFHISVPRVMLSTTAHVRLPSLGPDAESASIAEHESYRQSLLGRFKAEWRRPGEDKFGIIALDGVDIGSEDVQSYRLEAVSVTIATSTSQVRFNEPSIIRISWDFMGGSAFPVRFRLDPVNPRESESGDIDDSNNAVNSIEAALRNTIIEGRPWGLWTPERKEAAVSIGCCFLARGIYYFRATIFEARDPTSAQEWSRNPRSWQSHVLSVHVS